MFHSPPPPHTHTHTQSPTGCPMFGTRRWSRRKSYCCRLWLWLLTPLLTLLLAVLLIPLVIVLLPILVGYLVCAVCESVGVCAVCVWGGGGSRFARSSQDWLIATKPLTIRLLLGRLTTNPTLTLTISWLYAGLRSNRANRVCVYCVKMYV